MSENKYRIFDKMIEGVQIIDADWKYIYLNDTAASHGKFLKEELLGQSMLQKYPGIENSEMFQNLKKSMQDRSVHIMVNEFRYADNSVAYFELRIQPIDEGIIVFSFDATKQKEAQNFIITNSEKLEEMVNQRTAELMVKNKELEQFNYIASHDLQEPIRTIANYLQILKEDYFEKLDSEAKNYLEVMEKANLRMSLLTKALLDYSRIGINRKTELVDCNIVLNEVIADLEHVISSTRTNITIEKLPVIKAYDIEIRQLFSNLITNAIKFRKPEVPPKINVWAEKTDGFWQFSIADNGIGINEAHFERIFLFFQRLHSKQMFEGNGIGLAYCKKIIDLHHGKIMVRSEPGLGSTFIFTIPV